MINTEFTNLFDLLQAFPDEQSCMDHLTELRWNGNVTSPFDENSVVYKCAGNKYRCKNTGKYFNVKTGTLFDNTKVKLQKWFMAIMLITNHKKGISSVQLASDIGVTQKTAWFMLHRIRNCYGINDNEDMSGEIEVDETYVGGKNKNRHADKKVKGSQGRSGKDKVAVFGMAERGGNLKAQRVTDVGPTTLQSIITTNVECGNTIYSDEWKSYKGLMPRYIHGVVIHSQGEYVNGNAHTNTIEGFWSLLKRGIFGIYHHTSKKHLQKYLDEFTYRYNLREESNVYRFNTILTNSQNRLKYKDLIR